MGNKKTEEVVVPEKTNTDLALYDYGQDAQLGFDNTTTADYSIPFIGLLQSNSPEVGQNPQARVAGASVGMLINSVNNRLWPGDTGLVFVPCETTRAFVEWVPRLQGGGLVGVHQPDSKVVADAKARNGGAFGKLKTEAGNDLVETFYVYGLILPDENSTFPESAVCIAFKSTMIKSYKDVMYTLRSIKVKAPLYANRLRVTTKFQKNAKGEFMNINLAPIAWKDGSVTDEDVIASLIVPTEQGKKLLAKGKELLEMVRGGIAKVNIEKERNEGGSGEATDEVF